MVGLRVDEVGEMGRATRPVPGSTVRLSFARAEDPAALGQRLQHAMQGLGPVVRVPQRALERDVTSESSRRLSEPTSRSSAMTNDPPPVELPTDQPVTVDGSTPDSVHGIGQTVGFLRAHLGVLVVVLAVALGFAVFQVTRSHAESIPVPVETAAAGTPEPAVSASPTPPPTVRVHVIGSVQRPGVVTLPEGSRVVDVVEAAGGFAADADPADLNLAAPVPDGSQVLIGHTGQAKGELRAPGTTGASGATTLPKGSAAATQLDLNTATAEQLDGLPGVGPVTAQRILSWRDAHGRFSRVEELQEVDGIGPKTYSQIAPHVRV